MQILNLAYQIGLQPKKVASTYGGEYHCPCPQCGGRDRFILWPVQGRYWCRQCQISGDERRFSRNFLGSYIPTPRVFDSTPFPTHDFCSWLPQAEEFVSCAHKRLLCDLHAKKTMLARGLSVSSILRYQVGWNPIERFDNPTTWGVFSAKKIWLPRGIVLPTFLQGSLQKIKIRRQLDDPPKYIEIKGSKRAFSFFEYSSLKPLILVESEIDAMIICQEACDLCGAVALGGASKKPQLYDKKLLEQAPLLLYALDFDQAGKRVFPWWRLLFPRLMAWPVPFEKSPGDAFKRGLNLRQWIAHGIDLGEKKLV